MNESQIWGQWTWCSLSRKPVLFKGNIERKNCSEIEPWSICCRSSEGWNGSEGAEWECAAATTTSATTSVGCSAHSKKTHQEPGQDYWKLQGTARYIHNYPVPFFFFYSPHNSHYSSCYFLIVIKTQLHFIVISRILQACLMLSRLHELWMTYVSPHRDRWDFRRRV